MRFYLKTSLVALALGGLVGACNVASPTQIEGRDKSFDRKDYGDTPRLRSRKGHGTKSIEKDGDFLSLLSEGGHPSIGKTKRDTTLSDDDQSCDIPKGTTVYLVAEQKIDGDAYYVAQIATPCKVTGANLSLGGGDGSDANDDSGKGSKSDDGVLGEGNIPKDDVDVVQVGGDSDNASTSSDSKTIDDSVKGSATGCMAVSQFFKKGSDDKGKGARRGRRFGSDASCTSKPADDDDAVAANDKPAADSADDKDNKDNNDDKDNKDDQKGKWGKWGSWDKGGYKGGKDWQKKLGGSWHGGGCMVPGATFREPEGNGTGEMYLHVTTKGKTLKINTHSTQFSKRGWGSKKDSGGSELPEAKVELSKYASGNADEYEIPFSAFVEKNQWVSRQVRIDLVALDDADKELDGTCTHEFRMASPIVLDFSEGTMIETVPPMMSSTRFDLNADGTKDATGWVKGTDGFLVLDINNNGKIDNGAELFGEATKLTDGTLARDGYEALAQYDVAKKGFIDATDPVFARLAVWFDANSNGSTDPGELKSAKDVGLTKIHVVPESVPTNTAFQDGGYGAGNMVPFRARFEGPAMCGAAGCWSYDVFFGASSAVATK